MKELGVCGMQFERYFSIPEGVIRQVKHGSRDLPVKYWPIIYEKKVPKYGLGYISKVKGSTTHQTYVTKNVIATQTSNDTHGRVNKIK